MQVQVTLIKFKGIRIQLLLILVQSYRTEIVEKVVLKPIIIYLNIFSKSMIDMTFIVNMFDIFDKSINIFSSLEK